VAILTIDFAATE